MDFFPQPEEGSGVGSFAMNDDWKDDDLWALLGQARNVAPSPYFCRRVLREIRRAPERPMLPVFFLRWLGAGAIVVLVAGFFVSLPQGAPPSTLAGTATFEEVFDEAAGLDALVASGDISPGNYAGGL